MPIVNLIPMLDVLMSVLTFFIIISMMLATSPEGLEVQLPSQEEATQPEAPSEFLLVTLNSNGQILIEEQPIQEEEQLLQRTQAYLKANSQASVLLKAAPEVPYERVVQLLAAMRDVGGARVSLAVEQE